LGAPGDALPLLGEALEIRRGLLEPPDERLAATLFEYGVSLAAFGEARKGAMHLREALAMELDAHGRDHLHVAQVRFELASIHHDSGEGDAETEFREVVRVFRTEAVRPTAEYAHALMALGEIVAVGREIEQALALFEEALGICTELFGDRHPFVAGALRAIGVLRYNLGRKGEALAALREAADIDREVYGDEGHIDLAHVLQDLGNVLAAEEDPEGVEVLQEAVGTFRKQPSVPAISLGFGLTSLGGARERFGDPEGARQSYEEALATYEDQDVPAMFQVEARTRLARLLREQGPSQRAVELLSDVLEGYSAMLPDEHPRVVAVRDELEQALAELRER
jgi:tetratricopeptide (TPR) repeat protein